MVWFRLSCKSDTTSSAWHHQRNGFGCVQHGGDRDPCLHGLSGRRPYLGQFLPSLKQNASRLTYGSGDRTFRFGGAQLVASMLVVLFTVLNVFGVQRVA
jgi:hypothetical protein